MGVETAGPSLPDVNGAQIQRARQSITSSTARLSHPKYRPDLDGLRAVAVLSVVAFHVFPDWVKGGFVGVDVFFVISGYLISTIIFENLEKGTFSFAEFYTRRIRRIFPALLIVLGVTYAIGWFVLLPDEYRHLGRHIAAGAGFVSNITLAREAGYFDDSADTKPLLHLWSLGIEEQFYIVWPLLIWLAWRRRFNLLAVTALTALVSFSLNLAGIGRDAVATFYSTPARLWELSCGGALAWASLHGNAALASARGRVITFLHRGPNGEASLTSSNSLSVLGSLLLVVALWQINAESNFPGAWAALPVLGTSLIIWAGPQGWINRLLSNPTAVGIGLISYPLYLWHWPLLAFARIVESESPNTVVRLAVVVLSLVLAWLTYTLVERPVRLRVRSAGNALVLVLLMAIVGAVGYATHRQGGFPVRTQDREAFISAYENSFPTWKYFRQIDIDRSWRSECSFFNTREYLERGTLAGGVTGSAPVDRIDSSCYERDSRFDKAVLVWGDSHAQALSPGLTTFMPKNWQILQIASSGCLPNPEITTPSRTHQCDQSNYFAVKTIETARPDVVVIAQRSGHSLERMRSTARTLEHLGITKALFLGPVPQWTAELPKIFARQLWVTKPRRTFVGLDQEVMRMNAQLLRDFRNTHSAEYVDVIAAFCNASGCLTYTDEDITTSLTAWDYGHLTPAGSRFLAREVLIKRIAGQ